MRAKVERILIASTVEAHPHRYFALALALTLPLSFSKQLKSADSLNKPN
jgi:hypothetical protein